MLFFAYGTGAPIGAADTRSARSSLPAGSRAAAAAGTPPVLKRPVADGAKVALKVGRRKAQTIRMQDRFLESRELLCDFVCTSLLAIHVN